MSSQEIKDFMQDSSEGYLKFEDNIILKVPSLTSITSQPKSDTTRRESSDDKFLRVPSISRRRNSLLISPVLTIANGGSNNNAFENLETENPILEDSNKSQMSNLVH